MNNPQPSNARITGRHWERAAEAYLQEQGLCLLQRNFSSRFGEIDLIMQDNNCIVFVEVRYRRDARHGSGAATVAFNKRRKISMTAGWYLAKNPQRAKQYCRFDVISIDSRKDGQGIDWIKNAFYSTMG